MKQWKKLIAAALVIAMAVALLVPSASAADAESCTVIGADLSDDNVATVYSMFGIKRGSVKELTVTNSEERQYLEGKVSDSTLGTRSISCVYVEILPEGSGLTVTCKNISWCSDVVYKNALITAGITDANVIIAAPFSVSGTAALTGIYKAYETITGDAIDSETKNVAIDELLVTSNLADIIGSSEATQLVNELKSMLGETAGMSDAQLREQILFVAKQANIELTEEQIVQLIDLVRKLQNLDVDRLVERVKDFGETLTEIGETAEKVAETAKTAVGFLAKLIAFFESIIEFFRKLFG